VNPLPARKATPRRLVHKTPKTAPSPITEGPQVQPVLRVPDVEEALAFYTGLGFEPLLAVPGTRHDLAYAVLGHGTARFHLAPLEDPHGTSPGWNGNNTGHGPRGLGVTFYCFVPDVQAAYQEAHRVGCFVAGPPRDEPWGDRAFTCRDPYGYEWTFAQHLEDVSPEQWAAAWH
jgi:PhnB protein